MNNLKQNNFQDVSIVMISRNEEKSVKRVIDDIKKYAPGAEILLVDSSTDKTARIAKENGADVIIQLPPKGYGPAMEKALLTPKREIIITMDCDNTYPAEYIPTLAGMIRSGYDVVGTSRISSGKPTYMPWPNFIVNKIFNVVSSIVYQRIIRDVQTGMRAYRRNVLHDNSWWMKARIISWWPQIRWGAKGNSLPVELLLKPIRLGYKVTEIPIPYRQRLGMSTLEKFNSLVWCFFRIFYCRIYVKKVDA